jgi:predicted transcriptional regulator
MITGMATRTMTLRMPDILAERLDTIALRERRSLTAQILVMLERAVADDERAQRQRPEE